MNNKPEVVSALIIAVWGISYSSIDLTHIQSERTNFTVVIGAIKMIQLVRL